MASTLTPAGATPAAQHLETAGPMRVNVLVGGGYAWVATVFGPAFSLSEEWTPRVLAGLCLMFLLAGVLLAHYLGSWGRPLTLASFLGTAAATWVSLGEVLDVTRLEPVRAAFGGLGWMLFAFGWGAVREPRAVPEEDPNVIVGTPLTPRAASPRLSVVALGISLVGAFGPWILAWRVDRAEHAVLAHAVALGCGVAMLSAGSQISTKIGKKRHSASSGLRLRAASNAMGGVLLLVVLGLTVWIWRG